MDKLGGLGIMANFVGGLKDEVEESKPKDLTEDDRKDLEHEARINTQAQMAFGLGVVKKVKIQMDTSKAMAILGNIFANVSIQL